MAKHQSLKRLAIAVVALVSVGVTVPARTASAKAQTTPAEFRGVWIRSIGDSGYMQYHFSKTTFWENYGMYNLGKWERNAGSRKVKLGSKVKKNKTFTLSKKDKQGYRTLKFSTSVSAGKLKIKKVKVNKKTRLRIKNQSYKETHNYFKATKHWEVKNDLNLPKN